MLHLQTYCIWISHSFMHTIHSQEVITLTNDATCFGKPNDASSAITAHRTFSAISIGIDHFKVEAFFFLQEYDAVCTYPQVPVAQSCKKRHTVTRNRQASVVNHDKIIACTLVFMKWYLHIKPKRYVCR